MSHEVFRREYVDHMLVKRLHPNAMLPQRAHDTDAGLDVFALDGAMIKSHSDELLRTGFAMSLPKGWCAIVKEKSGRATKQKLTIGACVIDCDYRGEVLIHLFNNGDKHVVIGAGEKITQLLIVPVWSGNPFEVDELDETERGEGRMGSTGLRVVQPPAQKIDPEMEAKIKDAVKHVVHKRKGKTSTMHTNFYVCDQCGQRNSSWHCPKCDGKVVDETD